MAMSDVLAALGGMVLEHRPDGRFESRGEVPPWCRDLARAELQCNGAFAVEDAFPFLTVFMPEAEQAWRDGARADSELWTEVDAQGRELHLEATAVKVGSACVLVIMRNDRLFLERENLLQRARELRMTHGSLMKEMEEKDVLIHAIVHDLAAPLHSIIGVLSLLGEQALTEPASKWIELALHAAQRQRGMIVEILDIFTAEGSALRPRTAGGVELVEVLERAVAEREPVARRTSVRFEKGPIMSAPCLVVAEDTRLLRVLTNLLDNAFRHGPPGGRVSIGARREDGAVNVWVHDDGPGVAPEVLPRLFGRFARGPDGGAGLGLFFCRITVESWGGGIGYERPEEGGTRFWVRLKTMTESDGEAR
jgi:signal transduction histidine kinase